MAFVSIVATGVPNWSSLYLITVRCSDMSLIVMSEAKIQFIKTLGNPPTTIEIEAALRKNPNGKAPGESVITPKALKAFDDEHVYMLKIFLTKYWTTDDVDYGEWHHNTLCALRKPGNGKDYSNPNNWRAGICLAKIPAKVQSSIISTRLLSHLKLVGIETQYECVLGKGCTDA
eukprot:scaffold84199_cov28-Attheya_sp.AAC.1